MKQNITFDFTLNKWGGFELGDGEYFRDNLKEIIESKPDFFIFTEEKEDFFETTFIPNPFTKEERVNWTSQEWIDMFKYAITYKTSKEQVIERLQKKEKFGIYEVNYDVETIVVNNMFWYYLGLSDTGGIKNKCEVELHEKHQEVLEANK